MHLRSKNARTQRWKLAPLFSRLAVSFPRQFSLCLSLTRAIKPPITVLGKTSARSPIPRLCGHYLLSSGKACPIQLLQQFFYPFLEHPNLNPFTVSETITVKTKRRLFPRLSRLLANCLKTSSGWPVTVRRKFKSK